MKNRLAMLWAAALLLSALPIVALPAYAQDENAIVVGEDGLQPQAVPPPLPLPLRPRFASLAPRFRGDFFTVSNTTTVTNWAGSFTAAAKSYAFRMVGTDPSKGGVTTTVPTFLIPIKITLSAGAVYDPGKRIGTTPNSVMQNIPLSPLFQSSSFKLGTVDMGFTQYVDAFQRASLWSAVSKATSYHVLLGTPTLLPALALTVPAISGTTVSAFGVNAAYVDINYLDAQLQQYMKSHTQITPNSLPIFVSFDTYLHDSGGCCIGGYHSATGSSSAPQTYSYATYVDRTGAFSEDVAALSHEVGEWMADPFVNNNTPCGALEVGDPLVNHDFAVTMNGVTFHPQELAFLSWFALDNPSKGANKWYSFRNALSTACK